MSDSILDDIKKLLGIDKAYKAFDTDIVIHINSAFMILQQLGVGPDGGFEIEDESSKWEDFHGTTPLHGVKTYIYMRVRLVFDPPASSFGIKALEDQVREYEWRLNGMADPAFRIPVPEDDDE